MNISKIEIKKEELKLELEKEEEEQNKFKIKRLIESIERNKEISEVREEYGKRCL